MSNWEFYERHFGASRLHHYLVACDGDQQRAQELYRWNVATSAVFWESLAYFEVAFRNALDDRMRARHTHLDRGGHWIFDDANELGRNAKSPRGAPAALHRHRRSQTPCPQEREDPRCGADHLGAVVWVLAPDGVA